MFLKCGNNDCNKSRPLSSYITNGFEEGKCPVCGWEGKQKFELLPSHNSSESDVAPGSTPDEFELMDTLAVKLGVSGPISQEERNMSSLYKRRVLKKAIWMLGKAWDKE